MKNFKKHVVKPDPLYGSVYIQMLINNLLLDGKKEVAQNIVYYAINESKEKMLKDFKSVPEAFDAMIHKVRPMLGIKTKRIGGSNYQIPYSIPEVKSISKAMKMIRDVMRKQVSTNGISSSTALKKEFLAILDGSGESMKEKDRRHKMAEANKAYAHFA